MSDGLVSPAHRRRLRPAVLVGATTTVVVGTVAALWLVPSASADDVPANAIRAASYKAMQGVQTENTSDTGGGKSVGWLSDGDWMRFDDVDLGPAGAGRMSLRYSAAYQDRTGSVELRADSVTGPLLSTVPITGTGGWGAWKTATAGSQSPGDRHQVFLVVKSTQKMDFVNLNWFALSGSGSASSTPASTAPAPSSPSATTPSATTPSATTPSTTMPSSTTPTAGTPSPSTAGWIDVNPDAWKKQLAEFEALPDRPRPNANVHSEFSAACTFGHALRDDPIVLPGLPGASHMHSILGNNSLDAFSTADSLRASTGGSSCGPIGDKSAYWMPQLQVTHKDSDGKIVIDKVIEPALTLKQTKTVIYYGNLGPKDPAATKPIPFGLRMIVGNAKDDKDMPVGEGNQFYCTVGERNGDPSRGNNGRSQDGNWPLCKDDPGNNGGGTYHWFVRFPNCWDGKHLDSPNHKDHMAYDLDGTCPAAFPVKLPVVSFSISYPTFGEEHMSLASGRPSTMHADAFFAWDNDAMARRVKYCVIPAVQCNDDNPYPETGQYK